jgi:hypothetical protein
MRKTLILSLLATGFVTVSALRAAPGSGTQSATMPGYPAPGSPATVTVSSPGAEPRVRLRYKPSAGLKESFVMTMSISLAMNMAGMAMPMDMPIMKLAGDVSVASVAPNGDISYEIAFTGMTAEPTPGMDPSLAAMMQGAAGGITALKGTAVLTDHGVSKGAAINVDQIADPNLKQALASVSSSLDNLSTPLPDDAVGVGAKWEVRQALKQAGANLFQKVECELTAVNGQSVTIRMKTEQNAPPQSVENPALPGATLRIEKLTGSGTGTMTITFASLVPASEMSSTTGMAMSVDMGGQTQQMAVDTKMKLSISKKN